MTADRPDDFPCQRIVELLTSGAFALVPDMLAVIHGTLFQDLDGETDLRYVTRFLDNLLNAAGHELRSLGLVCQPLLDDPSLLRNVDPSQTIKG